MVEEPNVGVGTAIDYSLFILSRFREKLVRAKDEGRVDPVPTAVGIAMKTSGRTILFSGTIVMMSLFSLSVVNAPLFSRGGDGFRAGCAAHAVDSMDDAAPATGSARRPRQSLLP